MFVDYVIVIINDLETTVTGFMKREKKATELLDIILWWSTLRESTEHIISHLNE